MRNLAFLFLCASASMGCGAPMPSSDGGADASVEDPACAAPGLEPDLRPSPLMGAAVGANGALEEGQYVFSTTALRLKSTPAAGQRFMQAMGEINAELATQPGLLAYSFATSARCNVARTLTVWRDEASMYAFSTGAAHRAAVRAVGEMSRGGSRVTHWNGAASEANWPRAQEVLAASAGPTY
ncbi:MAG: antibiotic biosynthesis monooxygenase [Myxococcales bacterium]|nr:antibiotic biosynthesis monooxygenase [Myxococcales bacterium]